MVTAQISQVSSGGVSRGHVLDVMMKYVTYPHQAIHNRESMAARRSQIPSCGMPLNEKMIPTKPPRESPAAEMVAVPLNSDWDPRSHWTAIGAKSRHRVSTILMMRAIIFLLPSDFLSGEFSSRTSQDVPINELKRSRDGLGQRHSSWRKTIGY